MLIKLLIPSPFWLKARTLVCHAALLHGDLARLRGLTPVATKAELEDMPVAGI